MINSSNEQISTFSNSKTLESQKLNMSQTTFKNIILNSKSDSMNNASISIGSNNFLRVFILFILGSLLSFVLNILQMEYKSNLFPSNVLSFFQTIWWAIPVCGIAAGKIILTEN